MRSRRRHEGRQLLEKRQRLEHHLPGAVRPGMAKIVGQATVGQLVQALGGEGGASNVTASCGPGSYADLRDHSVVVFMG